MRKVILIITALLVVSPMIANAVPIVDADGNISNLDVGGTLYNVTWVFDVDPAAGDFGLFDGNQAFAALFMDAVLDAFTLAGFTAPGVYFGVDFAFLEGELLFDGRRFSSTHDFWGDYDFVGWGFASVTAVPEPATLALLCSGLLGMGLTRRRKKA